MNPAMLPADLVLAGGGVKGIGHVGALSVLEEHGYEFRRTAGTSAGAIVGALVAARVPAPELLKIMSTLDFGQFKDAGLLGKVPLLGPGLSVLFDNGIYEGDAVREWLREQLAAYGVHTFADLRIEDDPHSSLPPDEAYRLVVMATDVTRGELIRLPWDYHRYGLDPDKQLVCDAVRASMSIPFFFKPVRLDSSVLVDGGVLSNYPIDTFDRTDAAEPRWPTFGVTLIPKLPVGNASLFPVLGLLKHGPVDLTESLVTTMLVGHDQAQLAKPWIAARSIEVDTAKVGIVDFGLDAAGQKWLYDNGRGAASAFLEDWDWEKYRKRFRRPPTAATVAAA